MQNNQVLQLLGLATRAGKIVTGESLCVKAVQSREAKLVVVATDASSNTKKLFRDKTTFYNIPHYELATKEELGKAVGKVNRASLAVIDEGFAQSIAKLLK